MSPCALLQVAVNSVAYDTEKLKGRDLAPVLVELIIWGARHHRTDASPTLITHMENDRETFLASLA